MFISSLDKWISSPQSTKHHHPTWLDMRVDAQLKKDSSFSSLISPSVSLHVTKLMTLGNQVFMMLSSILIHSMAILFRKLLQSTGPKALKPKKLYQKQTGANLNMKYRCYAHIFRSGLLCLRLFLLLFFLPACWQIRQDQRRKRHVANIGHGLHDRVEKVQISFYNLAASDEVIVQSLGEI